MRMQLIGKEKMRHNDPAAGKSSEIQKEISEIRNRIRDLMQKTYDLEELDRITSIIETSSSMYFVARMAEIKTIGHEETTTMDVCPNRTGEYEKQKELMFPNHMMADHGGYYRVYTSFFVDSCLEKEILELWGRGVVTLGCCCGHRETSGVISVLEKDVHIMEELGYKKLPMEESFLWDFSFKPKTINEEEKDNGQT